MILSRQRVALEAGRNNNTPHKFPTATHNYPHIHCSVCLLFHGFVRTDMYAFWIVRCFPLPLNSRLRLKASVSFTITTCKENRARRKTEHTFQEVVLQRAGAKPLAPKQDKILGCNSIAICPLYYHAACHLFLPAGIRKRSGIEKRNRRPKVTKAIVKPPAGSGLI